MSHAITVLLADDHGVLRDGLTAALNNQPDIEVIGQAADGREAVALAAELSPDVAVLDIVMPHLNGIEATRQIQQANPAVQVIILSMHLTDNHVRDAFQAGAAGYVLKEAAGQEVIEAVRAVHVGQRYLSPQISDVLLDVIQEQSGGPSLAILTERERAILQLLVEGQTNAEIAAHLNLSPKTVHTYRSRMMTKLEIDNLPGLVMFAIQHGLISLK